MERCNQIDDKLEKHLEKYNQNNKEVLRLAMAVEAIMKEVRDHHKFSEENKKIREAEEARFKAELKPLLDSYYALISGRKIVLGLAITITVVGGAYLMVKNLIK